MILNPFLRLGAIFCIMDGGYCMPLDPGLKIPKNGYIKDRLQTLLNGSPKNEFLRSSQEEDITLLKRYQLIEEFDDYLELTHHGENILSFLNSFGVVDKEKVAPLNGSLYTSIVMKIDSEFAHLQKVIFEDMIEQMNAKEMDGYQSILFRSAPGLNVEITNLANFDSDHTNEADPDIPLNWLIYPEAVTVMIITSQIRTIEPLIAAANAGQELGKLLERHAFNYSDLEVNFGIYLSPLEN